MNCIQKISKKEIDCYAKRKIEIGITIHHWNDDGLRQKSAAPICLDSNAFITLACTKIR